MLSLSMPWPKRSSETRAGSDGVVGCSLANAPAPEAARAVLAESAARVEARTEKRIIAGRNGLRVAGMSGDLPQQLEITPSLSQRGASGRRGVELCLKVNQACWFCWGRASRAPT